MNPRDIAVRTLTAEDIPEVVDALHESFHDYPVMRFVLAGSRDYEKELRTLVRFFVMARSLRGEPLLGIGDADHMSGVALVSRPDRQECLPELEPIRSTTWAALGDGARTRYEAFGDATAMFRVDAIHIHLNMIGVRRAAQGKGVARALIETVHRMSREDPTSTGVTLTTEDEANVPLYEHLGYRVVGHAEVVPGLETWGFFRPDSTT